VTLWEQLQEDLEVRLRAEKYVVTFVTYFSAESEAKQIAPGKEAPGARAPLAGVEDLNGDPRRAWGVGRLSHRLEGSAKRDTTLWNPDRSTLIKDSQAIKGVLSRIA